MISIDNLCQLIAKIVGKKITIKHIDGPTGVAGRNSHNQLIKEVIGWAPPDNLEHGLKQTYTWIKSMIEKDNK